MGAKPSKSTELRNREKKKRDKRKGIHILSHRKNRADASNKHHPAPSTCTTEYISKLVLPDSNHVKSTIINQPLHINHTNIHSIHIIPSSPTISTSTSNTHTVSSGSNILYSHKRYTPPSHHYDHINKKSHRNSIITQGKGFNNSSTNITLCTNKSSLNSSGWTNLSTDPFSHIDINTSTFTELTEQSTISRHSIYSEVDKSIFPLPPTPQITSDQPILPADSILERLLERPSESHIILRDAFKQAQLNDVQGWTQLYSAIQQYTQQIHDPLANVYLAKCLISGLGVTANMEQGFQLLKSQHSCETYLTLGHCYLDGLPSTPPHTIQPIDKARAFECFSKAANEYKATNESMVHSISEAQRIMARMLFQGEGIRQNTDQALELLLRSADNDNMYAQFLVGVHYQRGLDISQDLEKAKYYYRKSAKQGVPDAQAALGGRLVVEGNYSEGIEWLEKAVQKGNTRARVLLGLLYDKGEGVQQNNSIALTHYKVAVENNNHAAQCILGLVFYFGRLGKQKNHKEAFRLIRLSAVSGFAYAQRVLGQIYQQGSIAIYDNPTADTRSRIKKNEHEAVRWYKRAAVGKDIAAMDLLGKCYEQGIGVEVNREEALSYYQKCTEQDSPYIRYAQLDQALLLQKMGRYSEAFKLFSQIVTLGHPVKDEQSITTAQLSIARYHLRENIEGVEYNPSLAISMLTSLAESKNDACAHYWLGCCYDEGILGHCEIDRVKAFHHYMIAAELDDDDAIFTVAYMMSNRIVPNKGPADAFPWYHKIGAKGHPMAMHCLGLCYYKGISQEKPDLQMALEWFEKAARAGVSESVAYIAGIYLQLSMANNLIELSQQHFNKAVSWLKQAAENNDTYSQRELGKIYLSGKLEELNHELAFELFQKAAMKNDPEAIAYLGDCYNKGSGTKKDLDKALEMYLHTASLGYPYGYAAAAEVCYEVGKMDSAYDYYLLASKEQKIAQTNIGKTAQLMVARLALGYVPPMLTNPDLFKNLINRTISFEEAFEKLYNLSTQSEFASAFQSLACCYIDGKGTEKDARHAIFWLEKSIDTLKDTTSMVRLAEIYGYGMGAPVDYELAFSLLKKSAEMGDTEAQYKMGMVFLQGEFGMLINERTAANWLKLSAAKLHSESIYALSKITNMINDSELELQYLKNAAALGHVRSMYLLGEKYLKQLEVPFLNALMQHDYLNQALKYLHMAGEKGDTMSLILLGKAYSNCTKTKIRFSASSATLINSIDNLPTPCDSQGYCDDMEERIDAKWRAEEDEKSLAIECFEKASSLGDLDATVYAAEAWHEQKQYAAALELFEKAASQGSIIARFFCARYSIEGFGGCELSPSKGFQELLICANEFKCVHAYNTLGQCYENGCGTLKDDQLAYQWYHRAAEVTQDAEAYYRIAQMYSQRRLPLPSASSHHDAEACKYYNLAINASPESHGLSNYHLGLYYLNGVPLSNNEYLIAPDICLAIEYFRSAAVLNVKEAMFELGVMFLNDDFPLEEQEEGYHYLQQAAEMESRDAQFELGLLYHKGKEVIIMDEDDESTEEEEEYVIITQDFEKAYDLFCRSAAQKHPTATYFLGIYHQHGIFVAPDLSIALEQYELSVHLFEEYPTAPDRWQAEFNLARILHQDHDSRQMAYRLFQAAHFHSPAAYKYLSEIMITTYHLHGWGGVAVQTEEAAYTLLRFAEEEKYGHRVYLEVAQCYEAGLGLPQDFRKAIHWYGELISKARHVNDESLCLDEEIDEQEAIAMFRLAEFYRKGIVVEENIKKANDLYHLAARKGSQEAKKFLSFMTQKLIF
ncbi:hypothetical protein BDB01DRAFT_713438 [Pilobolus umbonatus]|nr:hypothetical protein BDB01DRAFT_713438 [Pilobolus umbonatus]